MIIIKIIIINLFKILILYKLEKNIYMINMNKENKTNNYSL